MTLDFSSAVTHQVVDHGSATSVNNLNSQTWMFWVNPQDITGSGKRLIEKLDPGVQAWVGNPFYGNGGVRYYRSRATTDTDLQIAGGVLSADVWQFLAMVDSDGVAPQGFLGTLTSSAVETSYNGRTTGVGTPSDDSGNALKIGAYDDVASNSDHFIALVAVWNVRLTLPEILIQQYNIWYPAVQPLNCVLFCNYGFNGTNSQIDWSGNGNHGTVTGATVSAHVPLGPLRGGAGIWTVAAVGDLSVSPSEASTISETANIAIANQISIDEVTARKQGVRIY